MRKNIKVLLFLFALLCLNVWVWHSRIATITVRNVPLPRYTVTDIGTLGNDWVYHGGAGINNQGEVVGASLTKDNNIHAFLWRSGSMTDLGTLPGSTDSIATAINNRGQVVGESGSQAFLWQNGGMCALGTLPGYTDSWATAINDQGQIAGRAFTPRGDLDWASWPSHAFLWQKGVMRDLGVPQGCLTSRAYGINAKGQVVGWALSTDAHAHAFLWRDGTMSDLGKLSGKKLSRATSINDAGQIAGDAGNAADNVHALVWTGTQPLDIGTLPACTYRRAIAINNVGQTVGEASVAEGHIVFEQAPPFLWDASHGMQNLANLIPTNCKWRLRSTFGINDRGQILGFGDYKGHTDRLCLLTPKSIAGSQD